MDKIKLYGERNTGTNYLEKLMALNIDAQFIRGTVPRFPKLPIIESLNHSEGFKDFYFKISKKQNLGWKHSCVDINLLGNAFLRHENLYVVLLVKNPYSFLLSLHKKPYHNSELSQLTFEHFLQNKWKVQNRDNVPKDIFYIKNPIELWNAKTKAYLDLQKKFPSKVMIVKYENLVGDPESTIKKMVIFFNLTTLGEFKNYKKSTKSSDKDFLYYMEYYNKEIWKNSLTQNAIKLINDSINPDLCAALGYSVI